MLIWISELHCICVDYNCDRNNLLTLTQFIVKKVPVDNHLCINSSLNEVGGLCASDNAAQYVQTLEACRLTTSDPKFLQCDTE